MTTPIISTRGLVTTYRNASADAPVQALRGVDLDVHPGEIVGLIGESGSGKSTFGRALLGRAPVSAGSIVWRDQDISGFGTRDFKRLRRDIQIIPQDAASSLNPRRSIGAAIAEPLLVHRPELCRRAVRERVLQSLASVGLPAAFMDRFPLGLSGGQAQRVAIARALIAEPSLIICDEPVSALDVSIQAQIIMLLTSLQRDRSVALLFISHDLAVVRLIAQRVAVMYLGRLVETGDARSVCDRPRHPYTQALVASVLDPDMALEPGRHRVSLGGDPPSPVSPPAGCGFSTRCPLAFDDCNQQPPQSTEPESQHSVWCHAFDFTRADRILKPPLLRVKDHQPVVIPA